MLTKISCGWCHELNEVPLPPPETTPICLNCGHQVGVARASCRCDQCQAQARQRAQTALCDLFAQGPRYQAPQTPQNNAAAFCQKYGGQRVVSGRGRRASAESTMADETLLKMLLDYREMLATGKRVGDGAPLAAGDVRTLVECAGKLEEEALRRGLLVMRAGDDQRAEAARGWRTTFKNAYGRAPHLWEIAAFFDTTPQEVARVLLVTMKGQGG